MSQNKELTLFQKFKLQEFVPLKFLGQNFLYDINLVEKITEGEELRDKFIIEIGPGPGLLTEAILKQEPKKLILIEKDRKFVEFLKTNLSNFCPNKLEIIEGDVLQIKLSKLCKEKVIIISNLPYNISVKVLNNIFDELELVEKMILMFQKEVADRIIAENSTKEYGSLSIISQWLCEIKGKLDLLPGSFYPPPKICSSVLRFIPRERPLYVAHKTKLEFLCKKMFQTRRKMVRKTLKSLLQNSEEVLKNLNIDPTLRAENLTIKEFCDLTLYL